MLSVIGVVVGGIIGMVLPIQFDRVRTRGVEAVQLKVLGIVVRQSAGGPGELDRALSSTRTMLVGGLGLLGGIVLGGFGVKMSGGGGGPPPAPPPTSPPPVPEVPADPHGRYMPPPVPGVPAESPTDPHARYKPPPSWKPAEPGAAPDPAT